MFLNLNTTRKSSWINYLVRTSPGQLNIDQTENHIPSIILGKQTKHFLLYNWGLSRTMWDKIVVVVIITKNGSNGFTLPSHMHVSSYKNEKLLVSYLLSLDTETMQLFTPKQYPYNDFSTMCTFPQFWVMDLRLLSSIYCVQFFYLYNATNCLAFLWFFNCTTPCFWILWHLDSCYSKP